MTTTLPKVIADLQLSLAAAVTAGATTATLSSNVDSEGTTIPDGFFIFTIDRDVAGSKEYISATKTGTALTSIQSLTVQGAASSGFALYHRFGATVEITDWAALDRMLKNLTGVTGFDSGAVLGYDAAPASLTGNNFATVDYVLAVVNGGTVTFDRQFITNQTAGENLTANNLVYFKESDQKWWKVDADLSATYDEVQLGIAQSTVLANASLSIGISGPLSGFSGLTAGSKYYASNTAGGISTSVGTATVFVGWALSTTVLLFSPRQIDMPTAGQKDALVGTTGTPSTSNPYMTRTDNRAGLQKSVTAGTIINGATLPVPVFQNTTDNEYYPCDGNDTAKLNFQGFAVSNSTDANPIDVQFSGIVSGFTGLDEGVPYWLSDTVGTIQNTPGTYPVMVGVAISTTELLIQKGTQKACGTLALGTTVSNQAITTGFRPTSIRIFARYANFNTTSYFSTVDLVAAGGTTSVISASVANGAAAVAADGRLYSNVSAPDYVTIGVSTITNTGFTITLAETNTFAGGGYLLWEAEGDL